MAGNTVTVTDTLNTLRDKINALNSGSSASQVTASVLAGASALGTALWGYLCAAGAYPGVLLSPLSILLMGFGAKRAVDGRVRQPGLGTSRPRGFRAEEEIPGAARVGVPGSLAALFVAFSYDEGQVRGAALRAAADR